MTSPLQQKLKITGPVVVTANRLADGAVVYWRADGGWTTRLAGAAVATSAAAARELLAAASVDQTQRRRRLCRAGQDRGGRASAAGKLARGDPLDRTHRRDAQRNAHRVLTARQACISTTNSTARW